MKKHSPIPFKYAQSLSGIYSCPKENQYEPLTIVIEGNISQEDAEFLVHACNNHYKLVEALREMIRWHAVRHDIPTTPFKDAAEQKPHIAAAMAVLAEAEAA